MLDSDPTDTQNDISTESAAVTTPAPRKRVRKAAPPRNAPDQPTAPPAADEVAASEQAPAPAEVSPRKSAPRKAAAKAAARKAAPQAPAAESVPAPAIDTAVAAGR
jgi:hypothetical protein